MLLEAFRRGATPAEVHARTSIDLWFLRELQSLALDPRRAVRAASASTARSTPAPPSSRPRTPYFYSAWERRRALATRSRRGDRAVGRDPRLGAQPHRPGHRVRLLLRARRDDRPRVGPRRGDGQLQPRDGLDRLRHLRPPVLRAADARGRPRASSRSSSPRLIVQFGGQTPLKLAAGLQDAGVPVLGTSVDAIDLAEDRGRFGDLLDRLGCAAPRWATAHSVERRYRGREQVGFPLLVRPGYVLGGRAMEIVYSADGLHDYLRARRGGRRGPGEIFLDRFLENAIEVDVDALCDGEDVWIGGIMQHVEEAGVHSGDCACVLPPHSLGREMLDEIRRRREGLAKALGVVGLVNVQYAVADGGSTSSRPTRAPRGRCRSCPRRSGCRSRRWPAGSCSASGSRTSTCPPTRCAAAHVSRQGGRPAVRPLRRLGRRARPGDALHRRGHGHRAGLPDRVREGAGGGRLAPADRGAPCSSR